MQIATNFFPKPRDFVIESSFFKPPTKNLELGHKEKDWKKMHIFAKMSFF
jgi:hypothetical protein